MQIRVIGNKLFVEAFRLVGISGIIPDSIDTTENVIQGLLEEPDVAVILVSSSYAKSMGSRFRPYLERRKLPMVLSIPDRYEQEGFAQELRNHLQTTLGIRV